jgi:hypothetical protein
MFAGVFIFVYSNHGPVASKKQVFVIYSETDNTGI